MTQLAHAADTTTHREVYFIDDSLTDVDTLLAALPDGAPWYLIDSSADGVQQMAEVLADHAGLMAVHVIAHGTPGKLQLGNTSIDRAALLRQVCLWEDISAALDPDGDLLFYACELAGGRKGSDFIDTVFQLTGVNIAASRSLVGAAELGGNWDLGARIGSVKTPALNVQNYAGVFADPTVVEPLLLDATFDQLGDGADAGTVATTFGAFDGAATAVAVDGDGKIVVAGSLVLDPVEGIYELFVARYNADGSIDPQFNGGVMQTTSFVGTTAEAKAVGIDSNGRIVVVGVADDQFAIACFDADGNPHGFVETTGLFDGALTSAATGVAFVANGADIDIVIAGNADGDFGVAIIDATGTVTQSVTTNIAAGSSDSVAAVAVLADTILVAGTADDGVSDANFVLAKYDASNLNLVGAVTNIDFDGGVDLASAMAIDATTGQAVIVGTRISGADKDFVLARYDSDGSLDETFGDSGWVVTDFAGSDDEAFAVVIQADGKIVVSGRTLVDGFYDTVFARYNPDGTLDTDFDGDGWRTVAVDLGAGQSDDSVAAMAITDSGEIIAAGSAIDSDSGQTGGLLVNLVPVVPTLAAIAEDTVEPAGASVSSLVGANFSDADIGDELGGVAITDNVTAGQGVWEYNSNDGSGWHAVGLVDATSALLVAASDLLRFVPDANYNGTPGPLTMHLVDDASSVLFSVGASREVSNPSTTLGVSAETIALSTSVTAVADAPTLTAGASLAPIPEETAEPAGETVADLFGDLFADVDVGETLAGIAISGDASTAAQGFWEFSVDGLSWSGIGPVSAGAALLLDTDALLRFVPDPDFQGDPGSLAVHAVDSSAALNFTIDPALPQTFDTANDAETSGVAVNSVALSVTVTNTINDAPTIVFSLEPDTAFGNGGLVTTQFVGAEPDNLPIDSVAVGVALQGDGKIVVAGSTFEGISTDFAVARYDASGNLDATFGTGGKLTTQFVEGDSTAEAVAVVPVGNKIVVAGSVTDGAQSDFAVARYDAATGALDTSFGGDGTVTTAIGGGEDVATSISLDGGQVVLAGYSSNGADNDMAVVRYKVDGTLDEGFAGDGIATLDFGGTHDEANAVLVLGDGKVIVAGSSDSVFAVARFNENGTLDTSFHGDGMLTTNVGGFGFSIATTIVEQADGKILVGGYADGVPFNEDFALVRYNIDGSLDLSFGDNGVVLTDFGVGTDKGASVIIDADGKIVLSGSASNDLGGEDMAFARYNSDGSLDTSFGSGGLLQLAIGSGAAAAIASTLTGGGDVLAAGLATNGDGLTDFAVVQLTAATSVALASIEEDAAPGLGDTVSNLFGNSLHDVDGDTLAGVAVSANLAAAEDGVWEYSTDDGDNWFEVGGVADGTALLLSGDSRLRFLPEPDYSGVPGGLEVHLVDSTNAALFTSGAVRQEFNTTTDDQTSAVSANSIGLVTAVTPINDAPTGEPVISNATPAEGELLTASTAGIGDVDGLGGAEFTYQWQAGDGISFIDIDGATDASFTPGDTEVGSQLRVVVSFTDDLGTLESVTSAATAAVTNVNDAPTGLPLISDTTPTEDQALTVSTAGIADADGLSGAVFTYQWQAGDGTTFIDIDGATAASFTPGDAEVGSQLRVVVSYTDDQGAADQVTSAATAAVANVNEVPTGLPTISDTTPTEGQALTASTAGIADVDGLGAFTYQWQAGDGTTFSNIVGATAASFTPGDAEVGAQLRVVVSYTDGQGTAEQLTSAATAAVANVNDVPTGVPVISDTTPTQGQALTASAAGIADADGLGVFSYQWQAGDGTTFSDIAGANAASFTPGDAQVGSQLRVVVSYTDDQGTVESVTSAATAMVGALSVATSDAGEIMIGTAGADMLSGGIGGDWINGGAGADMMWGGDGNDTYVVDDVLDSILDDAGPGIDTVRTTLSNYTLGGQIENLVFYGAGSYVGTGNTVANVMYGATGGDTLSGQGGSDSLMGMGGDDTLDGGDGDDWLNGGDGVDVLIGGNDNDVYVVGDALDTIVEVAGQGIDTVMASGASFTLGAELENLVFTGSGSFTGTGNTAANVLYGGGAGDSLAGEAGADSLMGMDGNDTLVGGEGDDWLNGGTGVDALSGGEGNDTYVVDDALDSITEVAGQGVDGVMSTAASFTLGAEVENLVFTGAGNFVGTGNELANVIYGGAGSDRLVGLGGNDSLLGMDGNDTLVGGTGDDWLTGGAGNDVFVFSATGFGRDRVVDFDADPVAGQDLLDLSGLGITAATFGSAVTIQDIGADVLLNFAGGNSIHLVGIGDATTITAADFILAS